MIKGRIPITKDYDEILVIENLISVFPNCKITLNNKNIITIDIENNSSNRIKAKNAIVPLLTNNLVDITK